jgi:UDP-glucose 4-epimerase
MKILLSLSLTLFCLLSNATIHAENNAEKCILVVGGAGYIGSCVNEKLYESGYKTVVLDNLSKGHREAVSHGILIEGDLGNTELLDNIFQTYKIDAVMHFAAFLEVGESVKDPMKYYINNVSATLNLLQSMLKNNVKVFIFSSTAAIFGTPKEERITEEHPCDPVSPYGRSKLMVEHILYDFDLAYNMRYTSLRYFNAAGGDSNRKFKIYKRNQSNLIPVILRNVLKKDSSITVFGTDYDTYDGTCIRDYIHIEDLAIAHIAAMERLWDGKPSTCYNLGNGTGFSVLDVIQTAENITDHPILFLKGPRRPGDPAISVANSQKAQIELNWHPTYPCLEDIIRHTWEAMY